MLPSLRRALAALPFVVLVALLASAVPPVPAGATATATGTSHVAERAGLLRGWDALPRRVRPLSAQRTTLRVPGRHRRVTVQRRTSRGWRPVTDERSDARGRVVLRWSAPARSTRLRLRVRVPPRGLLGALLSPTRTVRVTGVPVSAPSTAATEVLRLVNVARRSARACGGTTYAAAPALNRDPRLEVAARRHARDMATYDYFDHDSRDGSRFSARITAAGYDWSTAGESIAAGYDSPAAVVRGWLDSPGHCANLMSAAFTEMGLGSATVDGSTYGTYWVQDLAAPR